MEIKNEMKLGSSGTLATFRMPNGPQSVLEASGKEAGLERAWGWGGWSELEQAE